MIIAIRLPSAAGHGQVCYGGEPPWSDDRFSLGSKWAMQPGNGRVVIVRRLSLWKRALSPLDRLLQTVGQEIP